MVKHRFCRDCLNDAAHEARRCKNCNSPRLISHEELYKLNIAHIDCDAFYASVEKRDNPDLAALPVIIGGGTRGVVATACYIARTRGVHSAMPMFKARKACPDAVIIKPDMKKYSAIGKQIRQMMLELTPLVEPLSIDEAFLDLSGTTRLHDLPSAKVLARFARRVETELGLSVSVGLSYCKFLAKIASDLDKPRGLSVLGQGEARDFLRQHNVSLFWGVGRATQAMLARDGIEKIATIQDMDESELASRYGSVGLRIARLAQGKDRRKVSPGGDAKSVSNETTFNRDYASADDLVPILRRLSEKVSARLKKNHLAGQTIVLKLKSNDFKTRTRNRTLADPTRLADKIFSNGRQMLLKELDGSLFRLLGIGVTQLCPDDVADPEDLIDLQATKRARAELTIDKLREKFGDSALVTGLTFGRGKRR